MSQDILPGEVFTDAPNPGSEVSAARLNNFLAGAVIQKELISGKSTVSPSTSDLLMFYDVSGDILGKGTVSSVVGTVALSDQAAGVASMRTLGTSSTSAAAGNDTRFPASVTGIRKGAGAGSADTAAVVSDYTQAPTVISLTAGAGSADASLNLKFTCALPANTTACTITINNVPDGSKMYLVTTQGGTGASTLTLVLNTGNGTGALTQKRVGGAGAITNSTNAIDKISIERFGSDALIKYDLAYA